MLIAMWVIGGIGCILVLVVALKHFKCKGCRGDGFVSEANAPTRAGVTTDLPIYEDQACYLCDGGKWMKYMRCPRCVGRGQIHKGANKVVRCPVCKGTGRLKAPFSAWAKAFFACVFTFVALVAGGGVLGFLLWGLWDFLMRFAAEAGMMSNL